MFPNLPADYRHHERGRRQRCHRRCGGLLSTPAMGREEWRNVRPRMGQTMGILGSRKLKRSPEGNWQLEGKTSSVRFVQLRVVFVSMGKWDDSERVYTAVWFMETFMNLYNIIVFIIFYYSVWSTECRIFEIFNIE